MAESKHIESDLIPKIATGFCSGISRTCGMCGAVSGAILAMSMLYGRTSPDQSLDTTYLIVQELIEKFKKKFGTTNCEELLGCDLRTKEGQKIYITGNLFEKCKNYIEAATEIVVSIMGETEKRNKMNETE